MESSNKKMFKLYQGDNMESFKKLPDNSIDSVVTDGPYGLSFMGKKWDYDVPTVDFWKEVYRVLKPGGHVLSFGGTRTYHRMVVNIEDAGFEIRDQIQWIYGSGFPKSLNIGKAVDKLQGNEGREVIDEKWMYRYPNGPKGNTGNGSSFNGVGLGRREDVIKKYISDNQWGGLGTGIKPANEPICLARKPISEKTIAQNVIKWGTGGINIDGCRIGSDGGTMKVDVNKDSNTMFEGGRHNSGKIQELNEGRFPANIILECICDEVIKGDKGEVKKTSRRNEIFRKNIEGKVERVENYGDKGDIHTNPNCPCRLLDEQSGVSESKKRKNPSTRKDTSTLFNGVGITNTGEGEYNDKGGASRFFYCAKVSSSERNMGLDGFVEKETKGSIGLHSVGGTPTKDNNRVHKNSHPTLKPVKLMTYLCRLVTPKGGIVLDPFMGSGSTGISALLEEFRFVGMEMDEEYFKIAQARIENYEMYRKFIKK